MTRRTDKSARARQDAEQEIARLAEEAERDRQRLAAALANMPIGLSMFDADKRLIVANAAYAEMYRLPAELIGPGTSLEAILDYRIGKEHFHGADPATFREDILALADRVETSRDLRRFPDGRIFSVIVRPLPGGGWVSTHEDVTAQYEAEQQIARLAEQAERERERLAAAIGNMPIGLSMFDADRRLIVANDRYAEMYSLPADFIRPGTPMQAILEERVRGENFPGGDAAAYLADLASVTEGRVARRDIRQYRDGRILSVIYQPMPEGGWVATHEDITDRRKAEAQIAHMARHDALTDLPNRVHFRERLQEALAHEAGDKAVAVVCLDLDHFKEVNDTLGHALGDKLLSAVASRLAGCVREEDTPARLGGDEFAVVQVGAEQPTGSSALAERIIEEMQAPFLVGGHQVVIGASVGIAVAPDDGNDAEQLLKNSDLALYRAKGDGRGVFRYFEPDMDARMQARRTLEMDLRKAVALGEFELHYQPVFRLETNEISGFEALLRWDRPGHGPVAPNVFIPVLEDTGLIVPVGEWVLKQACKAAKQWPDGVRVAVNLSATQFSNSQLPRAVVAALAESGLPATRLELEVTETVLLADTEGALAVLHQLKALGTHISMDDFGTGYSSLSYLQSFPFDKIKIDRRFVVDITTANNSLAIVRAVTGLSDSLGIQTTAEGVETSDQLDRIKAEGCSEAQGFLLGRPMPPQEATALFDRRHGGIAAA